MNVIFMVKLFWYQSPLLKFVQVGVNGHTALEGGADERNDASGMPHK